MYVRNAYHYKITVINYIIRGMMSIIHLLVASVVAVLTTEGTTPLAVAMVSIPLRGGNGNKWLVPVTVTDPPAIAGCGAGALPGVGNGDVAPAKLGNGAAMPECGTVSAPHTGFPRA
jgi:hypothetical protein